MIVLKVLLGMIGISFLILIHEFGHFIAAIIMGVNVRCFSIGLGKKLLKKKIGSTEFAFSLIPLGGYCEFKGRKSFQKAIEEKLDKIPLEEGSYYSLHPLKRIIIVVAGPLGNFLLAIVALFIISWIPYSVVSSEPVIVLNSDYTGKSWPADEAGLQTGDRILSINGNKIQSYNDISKYIASSAGKEMTVNIQRDRENVELQIIPSLDKDHGVGKIGIYPLHDSILKKDFYYNNQLLIPAGSRITSFDGYPIKYRTDIFHISENLTGPVEIEYFLHDGETKTLSLIWEHDIWNFFPLDYQEYEYSNRKILDALTWVKNEFNQYFTMTIKGLYNLFQGLIVTESLVGPIRIPLITGELAIYGFQQGFFSGLRLIFSFLGSLSISLGIANLLPIPALDGGQIILFFIDGVKKNGLSPRFVFNYQIIGSIIVLCLMVFTLSLDIINLIGK